MPAGTGLSRRRFIAQGARRRTRRVRRLAPRTLRVRGGHRRRRHRRPAAGARLDLPRGRRGRALGAVAAGRPALPEAPPDACAERRDGARRGQPAVLAPGDVGDRTAVRRAQGDGDAGDRLHARRPVALHVAPLLGGRRDRHAAAHGLARPLPRRRRHGGQPAPGTLLRRHACAFARDDEGAGRGDLGPGPVRLLQQPRLGRGAGPDARDVRPLRRAAGGSGVAHGGRRRGAGRQAAEAAAAVPVAGREGRATAARSRTRPRPTTSRRSSPVSPRCSARACRCARSR